MRNQEPACHLLSADSSYPETFTPAHAVRLEESYPYTSSACSAIGMSMVKKVVRALDECGVLAYWVDDDEEALKLAEIWDVRG